MLDLETLGTRPGSVIVSIGAVVFDPRAGTLGAEFYSPINVKSSEACGLRLDSATVLWWLGREAAARAVFSDNERAPSLPAVLLAFASWLEAKGTKRDLHLWGNGADFDNALLSAAYDAATLPQPWPHWANRCFRTARVLLPAPDPAAVARVGTYHNALDDAKTQARHLSAAYRLNPELLSHV